MATSIKVNMAVDGASDFKRAFTDGAAATKRFKAELEALDSEYRATGDAATYLQKRMDTLKRAIDYENGSFIIASNYMTNLRDVTDATGKETEDAARAVLASKAALDNYQAELDETAAALEQVQQETENMGKKTSAVSPLIQSVFEGLFDVERWGYMAVNAGKKIASAFVDIGKSAVEYNAETERYSKTISAFFQTAGQDSATANKNAEQLIQNQRSLSKQIGINSNVLIDANKMLIAAGVNGDRAQDAIAGLSKAIVATGGGDDELRRMAQNLQQIQNVGKASAMDMKQFGMAGVDAYSLISEQTGLTVAQLKEMDITFDMISDALIAATQEGGRFFEASQVGAQTLDGQMNILKSTVEEKLGVAFQPFNDELVNQVIPNATKLIEGINWESLNLILGDIAGAMGSFSSAVAEMIGWYGDTFGQPAVEAIDATKIATDDLGTAFLNNAGAIEFYDGAVNEAFIDMSAGGKRMATEVDGSLSDVSQSALREANMARVNYEQGYNSGKTMDELYRESAGKAKQVLIDYGWEAMANGETNALMYADGWEDGQKSFEDIIEEYAEIGRQKLDQEGESYGWGSDMMSGYDAGIASKEGSIIGRISNFAGRIRSYLHFSRPDEGPLRDYEQWMPDFMEGLARGISQNAYLVEREAQKLANSMAMQMTTSMAVVNSAPNYNSFTINQAPGQSPRALVREINRSLGVQYV